MRDFFYCIDLSFDFGERNRGDFIEREFFDFGAIIRTLGMADAGVEKAEIVVDLGGCAHGRSGVVGDGFLVDGDTRREAAMVYVCLSIELTAYDEGLDVGR